MCTDAMTWNWWITVIEIPVIAALFALYWQVRAALDQLGRELRDQIANDRIESIHAFASQSALKEHENRLTSHLLRIEAKLDVTSLKAEILFNQEKNPCEKH